MINRQFKPFPSIVTAPPRHPSSTTAVMGDAGNRASSSNANFTSNLGIDGMDDFTAMFRDDFERDFGAWFSTGAGADDVLDPAPGSAGAPAGVAKRNNMSPGDEVRIVGAGTPQQPPQVPTGGFPPGMRAPGPPNFPYGLPPSMSSSMSPSTTRTL